MPIREIHHPSYLVPTVDAYEGTTILRRLLEKE